MGNPDAFDHRKHCYLPAGCKSPSVCDAAGECIYRMDEEPSFGCERKSGCVDPDNCNLAGRCLFPDTPRSVGN